PETAQKNHQIQPKTLPANYFIYLQKIQRPRSGHPHPPPKIHNPHNKTITQKAGSVDKTTQNTKNTKPNYNSNTSTKDTKTH
ncbi:hypothetical protein, partial [Pseudomonas syringae]|uniref:hypothetical protein n=1 Tax=Pseudomonas syringae TaxID=317 RepID=UPI0034D972FD